MSDSSYFKVFRTLLDSATRPCWFPGPGPPRVVCCVCVVLGAGPFWGGVPVGALLWRVAVLGTRLDGAPLDKRNTYRY